jgi:hypothetical protein
MPAKRLMDNVMKILTDERDVVEERLSRLNAAIDALRDGSGIVKYKRTMSPEARAKISKAAKFRWSKIKR